MWLWLDLFWRFVLASLLAFGGGRAALPLIERLAVRECGWVGESDFAAAVGCGYATPGPVLITVTFIGYRAGGVGGAAAATLGVFLMSWLLAAAARLVRGAAVMGLLALTAFDLARHAVTDWALAAVAGFAARAKVHPAFLLLGGAAVGGR